jgi:hypothetical protein
MIAFIVMQHDISDLEYGRDIFSEIYKAFACSFNVPSRCYITCWNKREKREGFIDRFLYCTNEVHLTAYNDTLKKCMSALMKSVGGYAQTTHTYASMHA